MMPVIKTVKISTDYIWSGTMPMYKATATLLATTNYHQLGIVDVGKLLLVDGNRFSQLPIFISFILRYGMNIDRVEEVGNIEMVWHKANLRLSRFLAAVAVTFLWDSSKLSLRTPREISEYQCVAPFDLLSLTLPLYDTAT